MNLYYRYLIKKTRNISKYREFIQVKIRYALNNKNE